MSKISVWFLVAVVVFSAESNGLRFCPDNRVRRRELLNNIANEQPRLSIYSLEINSPFQYGKSVSIWRTENEISTETYSRNLDEDRCDEFPLNNGTITDRVEWRRSGLCRKFEWYITVDADDGRQDRFISQDTTKYFWWFSCFDGTTEVVDNCNQGYLDLVIPDTRTNTSDINLNGTPWELIAEDLKDFTGLSTEDVRYVWLGEGKTCRTRHVTNKGADQPGHLCQRNGRQQTTISLFTIVHVPYTHPIRNAAEHIKTSPMTDS